MDISLAKRNNLNTHEKIFVEFLGRKFLEGSLYVSLLYLFNICLLTLGFA